MADLISIIIPCYNAEKYIDTTINSVLAQSYSNLEILCIDDGSTESTVSIIESIEDLRIKIYQKDNTGVSDTRNFGFKKAKGEFVLFLDSDDILCPTFLEDRLSILQKTGNIACCSEILLINEEGDKMQQENLFSANISEHIFNHNRKIVTCPSAYLLSIALLLKHKIYFNKTLQSSADKYFLLEVLAKGKIDFIESSPLYYRVVKNSMSRKLNKHLIHDHISFYYEIKLKISKSYEIKPAYYSRLCYTIGASGFYIKDYYTVVKYLIKSFVYSPKTLFSLLKRKFR